MTQISNVTGPIDNRWFRVIHQLQQDQRGLLTPMLIYDAYRIADKVQIFREELPGVDLHWAVKSAPHNVVIQSMLDLGVRFDVASANEMQKVIECGAHDGEMLLSHPVKSRATWASMVESPPFAVVIDSFDELKLLARHRISHAGGTTPVLLARIKTESSNRVKDDLSHKWGASPDLACRLLRAAHRLGFRRLGLGFHVGTQATDPSLWGEAVAICEEVRRRMWRHGLEVRFVDLGGGFPSEDYAARAGIELRTLLAEVNKVIEPLRGHTVFLAEPGRALVADAAVLVMSVINVRTDGGQLRVIVDDHLYGSLSGQVFDARQFDFTVLRPDGRVRRDNLAVSSLFGATCDSIDELKRSDGQAWQLPRSVKTGDLIVCPGMGAYSAGWAFNGLEPATTMMISHGENGRMLVKSSGEAGKVHVHSLPEADVTRRRNSRPRPR
jgi:ornithine decarboxylase